MSDIRELRSDMTVLQKLERQNNEVVFCVDFILALWKKVL